MVIFTTVLPEKATLQVDNEKVRSIVNQMTGNDKVLFVEKPTVQNLGSVMDPLCSDFPFRFTGKERVRNIHKIRDGKDVWYFANPDENPKDVEIEIIGEHRLELWDPHTGETGKRIKVTYKDGKTLFRLRLDKSKSVFIVADI